MRGADLILHDLEALAHTLPEMGMADIEAEPYVLEMRCADDLLQAVGSGDLVGNVLYQHGDPDRLGKNAEVLERGDRIFHLAWLPLLFRYAEVLDQEPERRLLSKLNGALNFIHCRHAFSLVIVDDVHLGRHVTSVVRLAIQRRV